MRYRRFRSHSHGKNSDFHRFPQPYFQNTCSSKSGLIVVACRSRSPCKTRAKTNWPQSFRYKTPGNIRGNMNAAFDYDLTHDQWEMLKALRASAPNARVLNRFVVGSLVALQLAETV